MSEPAPPNIESFFLELETSEQKLIDSELRPNENLLWASKPTSSPISFIAVYVAGFSMIWLLSCVAFVIIGFVAIILSINADISLAETLYAIAVGAVFIAGSSLFLWFGVLMFRWALRLLVGPGRELYALTDQRGLIISPYMKYRVASLSPEVLRNVERSGEHNSGALNFKPGEVDYIAMWKVMHETELSAFRNIQFPKQVEDLIYLEFPLKSQNET